MRAKWDAIVELRAARDEGDENGSDSGGVDGKSGVRGVLNFWQ